MTGNKKFDRVNDLYQKYLETAQKAANDNYEVALMRLREEIIISVLKIYSDYEKLIRMVNEEEDKRDKPIYDKTKAESEFYPTIIEEVDRALKEYETSGSPKNCFSFCQHVCMKIKQKKGSEKSNQILSDNTCGMKIPNKAAHKIRRIKKCYDNLEKMHYNLSEDELIGKVAEATRYSKKDVKKFLSFTTKKVCSLESEQEGDDGLSLKERFSYEDPSPDQELVEKKEKNKLEVILHLMEKQYAEKKDPFLSEALTVNLLMDFNSSRKEHIKKNDSLDTFECDIYVVLNKKSFVAKEILEPYFTDPEYNLPTLGEISKKYGFDESTASQKVKRFREKFKKELKKYNL